jgi:hypothetical protein
MATAMIEIPARSPTTEPTRLRAVPIPIGTALGGRCASCRWWSSDTPQWSRRTEPAALPRACGRFSGSYDEHPAFIDTTYGEPATFYTSAEFGCTEFAPRETPQGGE